MNEGIKKFEELLRTDESFQTKLKTAAVLAALTANMSASAPVVPAVMARDSDVSLLALVLHMAAWVKGNEIILLN